MKFVLTNTHPIITGVIPLVACIVEIGGIHVGGETKQKMIEVASEIILNI